MALVTKEEEYITCPYEKSHQILESRIQFHLVKCAVVHPDTTLMTCPFNVTHKVPEPEFNIHCKYVCPDRGAVENYLIKSEEDAKPLFEIKKVEIESSEDWDNVNVETYNPEAYCQTAPILQYKAGVPPSVRKNFRAKERLRVQQLRNVITQNKTKEESSSEVVRLPQTVPKAFQAEMIDKCIPPSPIGKKSVSPIPLKSSSSKSYASSSPPPSVSPVNLFYGYEKCNEKTSDDDFIIPRYNARGRGRGRFLKK